MQLPQLMPYSIRQSWDNARFRLALRGLERTPPFTGLLLLIGRSARCWFEERFDWNVLAASAQQLLVPKSLPSQCIDKINRPECA